MNWRGTFSNAVDMFGASTVRSVLPDLVADSMESLGTRANRHDMLKRMRLPMSMYSMELEWRQHPVQLVQQLLLTNMKMATCLFWAFLLSTLVVAPTVRMFGSGLLSPVTYPVIAFLSALVAYRKFCVTGSFSAVALWFVAPQGVAVFLEWSFSPGIGSWWAAIPVIFSLGGAAYLADQVNTHYVRWITANLKLKREAVQRRRKIWNLRFNWFALTREVRALEIRIQELENDGNSEEAFILRRRAGELLEIREYPLGFLVLVYVSVLLFLGASTTMLVTSASVASFWLAFRRPFVTLRLSRLIADVNVRSFVSWCSWDTAQQWVHSPGVFHDGLSSRVRRTTQTVVCFVLIQIAFIPPIQSWGLGEALTPKWLWTSGYHFFVHLLFPVFFLLCALVATGARPLWMHLDAIEWVESSEEMNAEHHYWDGIVGRLLKSSNKTERQHLFLGFHAEYGYPVLIPKRLLNEHCHILGDSGSGKTSRVLTPLITQLIRGGEGAVVIIDLKGEASQMEAARIEAEKCGRVFKQCTNVLGLSSYIFNPFRQLNTTKISVGQIVETFMESLRLNHGDGYGSRYFTSQTRQWLSDSVKRWPNISSFQDLMSKATPEFFKNEAAMDRCREAISVIQQVAEVAALNWKPGPNESDQPLKDAIFMPDVVREKQVIYFWLPALGETSTVKEMANLGLYDLMTAVKETHEAGFRSQTYLVIDEFQQMAAEGFKLILRQARSSGLSLILANQSEADLMTKQSNRLLDVVRANTQTKLYLSINDPNTVKLLEKASGVIAYADEGGKLDYRPRLTVNDIRHYSSHSDLAICWITRDAGFAAYGGDWFGLQTTHHITEEEFERRDSSAWPSPCASTIVAERTLEGTVTLSQGKPRSEVSSSAAEEEGMAFVVPHDSKWAKRLMDVFENRLGDRRNDDEA